MIKREELVPILISVLLAFVLQSSIASHIGILGSKPDLVAVTAIAVGLSWGPQAGLLAGSLGGLLMDINNSRFIGLLLLTRGAAGLIAGAATKRVFRENIFIVGALGFLLTVLYEALVALILLANRFSLQAEPVINMVLMNGFLNSFATPVVFYIVWKQRVKIESRNSAVAVE